MQFIYNSINVRQDVDDVAAAYIINHGRSVRSEVINNVGLIIEQGTDKLLAVVTHEPEAQRARSW